jgi:hypothetical protein
MLARRMEHDLGPRAAWRRAVVAAAVVALAPSAAADGTVVAVDCLVLTPELRAALESRAKADLLSRGEAGTFVVVCGNDLATLTWHSLRGGSAATTVPLGADTHALVDRLLAELDPLTRPAPDASVSPALLAGAPSSAPAAPGPAPPATPVPEPAAPPPPSAVVTPTPETDGLGWAASVGAFAELWSPGVFGVLGPRARAAVVLPSGLTFGASGVIAWTPGASGGVHGRLVRLGLDAEYPVGEERRFRLGASAFVDTVHATPDSTLQTAPADATVPAAGIHALYAFGRRPLRLLVGPTVGFHAGPVRVELGPQELFRIPAVTVGALVAVELAHGSP